MDPQIQSRNHEISLVDYARVVWRHRWMIAGICFIAMAATATACLLLPPRYVAEASIVPPLEQSAGQMEFGMGLLGGAEAALLRNVMDVTSVADLYVGILESRAVADTIIDQFDLIHVGNAEPSRHKARERLKKNTSIDVSTEGIVHVEVDDRDPNRAAAIANAYIEELDRQNKRLSGGQATSKRIFLENRLREVEQKLSRIDTISAREAQVQETLYELLTQQCELAKIEEAKSMPTIQVLDPAVPPERRKARRTMEKMVLMGIVSFVFGALLAFSREYVAQHRGSHGRPYAFGPLSDPADGGFADGIALEQTFADAPHGLNRVDRERTAGPANVMS